MVAPNGNSGSDPREDNHNVAFFQHNNSSETLHEERGLDWGDAVTQASRHFWPPTVPVMTPGPISGPTMIPVPTIMVRFNQNTVHLMTMLTG